MTDTQVPAITTQQAQLDVYRQEFGLSKSEIGMIKDNIARGSTDSQLRLFLYQAKSVGLNPLKNQCRLVVRKSKGGPVATFQTTIDGYRAIAHRSGSYAGMDDVVYDTETAEHPTWAKVTVYKIVKGHKVAFAATARWSEYFPVNEKQQFMWKRMPFLMLGKVTEALALRKAFPEDLAGVYMDEEMHQADAEFSEPLVEETSKPSMESAKPKEETIPAEFEEETPEEKQRLEDSTRTETDAQSPTESTPPVETDEQEPELLDIYSLNKTKLMAFLKSEIGGRYKPTIYSRLKKELLGDTPIKEIPIEGFQNFYESLEEEALKMGFEQNKVLKK